LSILTPSGNDYGAAGLETKKSGLDHGIIKSPNLDSLLLDSSGNVLQMNLSEDDKNALEAFLRTLTDDAMLNDPKFSDPFQ